MQQLIIEFKDKLEKNKIVLQDPFDNYTYYYVLESITRLTTILENNKNLAYAIDVNYSSQIIKFLDENFLDYKTFKVDFKVNNLRGVIGTVKKLEKIYARILKVFPAYSADMKAKHGKEVESFLNHLVFECALTNNHLKLINSELEIISKYKEITKKL